MAHAIELHEKMPHGKRSALACVVEAVLVFYQQKVAHGTLLQAYAKDKWFQQFEKDRNSLYVPEEHFKLLWSDWVTRMLSREQAGVS